MFNDIMLVIQFQLHGILGRQFSYKYSCGCIFSASQNYEDFVGPNDGPIILVLILKYCIPLCNRQ